jgi:hypothetical protein
MMWKGVIPEGTVCNNIASGIDILPTLASITGAPLSRNKIDGVDIFPLMQGNFNFPKGLYDLRRDPGERYDLLEFYPEIAEKLEEIAMKTREELGDDLRDMPGKNRREPGLVE